MKRFLLRFAGTIVVALVAVAVQIYAARAGWTHRDRTGNAHHRAADAAPRCRQVLPRRNIQCRCRSCGHMMPLECGAESAPSAAAFFDRLVASGS